MERMFKPLQPRTIPRREPLRATVTRLTPKQVEIVPLATPHVSPPYQGGVPEGGGGLTEGVNTPHQLVIEVDQEQLDQDLMDAAMAFVTEMQAANEPKPTVEELLVEYGKQQHKIVVEPEATCAPFPKTDTPDSIRNRALFDYEHTTEPYDDICDRHKISRKTLMKWVDEAGITRRSFARAKAKTTVDYDSEEFDANIIPTIPMEGRSVREWIRAERERLAENIALGRVPRPADHKEPAPLEDFARSKPVNKNASLPWRGELRFTNRQNPISA